MSSEAASRQVARRDGVIRRALGHFHTIGPVVHQKLVHCPTPAAKRWQTCVANDRGEPILRTGLFRDVEGESRLVVVLHGMGGAVDRSYCEEAARAAERAGLPCFRLSLRGADGMGTDLHHAGFTDDLGPILNTPPFDRFEEIALVGYSLGGHVSLAAAADGVDERLGAVAALCPPLDLEACQEAIDAPRAWVYRTYLLRRLKKTYPRIARRGRPTTPVERIAEVDTLREWDRLTVVPRFGFRDVDQYYQTQSMGPRLAGLATPSLVVASPGDPMVPAASLRGWLGRASQSVVVRWVRDGGHVFFPPGVDLGFGEDKGVENQVMQWVKRQLS